MLLGHFLTLMLTLGRQKIPSVSGLDSRNPFYFIFVHSSPVSFHCLSVCVEAIEMYRRILGEFALLAMKIICIVYETTKSTSSKSNNSMLFSFFHFILFFSFVLFLQNISKNV